MKIPGKMLVEVCKSIFKKPATSLYPFEKATVIKNFRGALKFTAEKCIGCKLCERDCPSNAIKIIKVGDRKFNAEINYDKCIYCGQCVDSCAKDALEITGNFELAQLTPDKLKVVFHAAEPAKEPGK